MYDYIIVGSGIFGSVFARELTDHGKKCLVIDKRSHIAGNCHTSKVEEIQVHDYGPHIFHTNSEYVWNYVNRFAKFNHFRLSPRVNYKNNIYSFPINLMTFHQLWGVKNPQEAIAKIDSVKIKIDNPSNLEEWILSQVGEEIYEIFIKGYTTKQWGKDPKDLPSSIVKRLPIRFNFNDNYYNDIYQGIPIGGYTEMFKRILDGIDVDLNVDYMKDRQNIDKMGKKTVYTGALDEFFNCDMGVLEWRSLKFDHSVLDIKDFQGCAVVNYNERDIPFTRICEHKHFEFGSQDKTVITKEYPQKWDLGKEKYYPINDEKNNELAKKYKSRVDNDKYIFGGRLADYMYYDMHHVFGSALARSKEEISR